MPRAPGRHGPPHKASAVRKSKSSSKMAWKTTRSTGTNWFMTVGMLDQEPSPIHPDAGQGLEGEDRPGEATSEFGGLGLVQPDEQERVPRPPPRSCLP